MTIPRVRLRLKWVNHTFRRKSRMYLPVTTMISLLGPNVGRRKHKANEFRLRFSFPNFEPKVCAQTAGTCPPYISFFVDGATTSKIGTLLPDLRPANSLLPRPKICSHRCFRLLHRIFGNLYFLSFFKHRLLYHTALLRPQTLSTTVNSLWAKVDYISFANI